MIPIIISKWAKRPVSLLAADMRAPYARVEDVRSSSGVGYAIGCSALAPRALRRTSRRRKQGHRHGGVRAFLPVSFRNCSNRSAGCEPIGQVFPSTKSAPSTSGFPAASRSLDAGTKASRSKLPDDVDRGGGAAAVFHRQRDLMGSAYRHVRRTLQWTDDLHRKFLKSSTDDVCRRQSPRPARAAVLRAASSVTLDEETKANCRSIRLDDLPPRESGESSKNFCCVPSVRQSDSHLRSSLASSTSCFRN